MNSHSLLRDLLARDPRMSLIAIRDAHPVFRTMSVDGLSLRTAKTLEALGVEHRK